MRENQRRVSEKSRREREMDRVASIVDEMASGIRFLGGDGSAKEQNWRAARKTGLAQTVIERLRWRKMKRVPADIADAVREAIDRHTQEGIARAQHEVLVAKRDAALMAARLAEIDPDFYGAEIDTLRRQYAGSWLYADRKGGE